MKEKMIKLTETIFAYGMLILLVITAISAAAYIIALIAGQPLSVAIHAFFSEYVFPPVYVSGILLSIIGMLNLYLKGVLLFRFDVSSSKKKGGRGNEK